MKFNDDLINLQPVGIIQFSVIYLFIFIHCYQLNYFYRFSPLITLYDHLLIWYYNNYYYHKNNLLNIIIVNNIISIQPKS